MRPSENQQMGDQSGQAQQRNQTFTQCANLARSLPRECTRPKDKDRIAFSELSRAQQRELIRNGEAYFQQRGDRNDPGWGDRTSPHDRGPRGDTWRDRSPSGAKDYENPRATHGPSKDPLYGENARNNQFRPAASDRRLMETLSAPTARTKGSSATPRSEETDFEPKRRDDPLLNQAPVAREERLPNPADKRFQPEPRPLPEEIARPFERRPVFSPPEVPAETIPAPAQASLLPDDDPLPPLPLPVAVPAPAASDEFSVGFSVDTPGVGSFGSAAPPVPLPPTPAAQKKKQEDEELKALPDVKLEEPEGAAQVKPAERKTEEKEEKGFFGKLSDTVFNFFGFGDDEEENASRTPEEVLAEKQFDPLAQPEKKPGPAGATGEIAEETLKSEKWFGEEKEHNPEAKLENAEAYKVTDPVFDEKPKETAKSQDETAIERQNEELPVIVLSGQPKFDPTKVADQIREIEKNEVKRSMAGKTLEELAIEANLQRAVPLEDAFQEPPEGELSEEPYEGDSSAGEDLSGLSF